MLRGRTLLNMVANDAELLGKNRRWFEGREFGFVVVVTTNRYTAKWLSRLDVTQGMDWLVEKVKNPIQRDADYYYHRAAELRFLGAAGTPTFKDAEDDLVKAVEVSRLNQQGRGGQTKRAQVRPFTQFDPPIIFSGSPPRPSRARAVYMCWQPDSKAHRELQEELQRAKDARLPRLVKS